MYRDRRWTIRQYAGFGTAEETNAHFHYLLQHGQTGLSVAFDLPTQLGLDSDAPLSAGEVGKVGVAIDSLKDIEILFQDLDLATISVSMTANAPAAILLAMVVALARQRGTPERVLRGTLQNDPLKEYTARGTYIFPPAASLRLCTDCIEYAAQHIPRFNPISISGYHMREAGSTAAQELAFTLAHGLTYIEHALARGLDIDDFAPRLSFFFSAHQSFLEEIAKFRAARRLWATLVRDRFGARNPKSMMLRFHTQTAGCTLTAEEPLNNIIRVTLQALSAVLGGTQSLHTNSYAEALSLPTPESVRLALRTQQILAYETGLAEHVDPLGGSAIIEQETDRIEQEALQIVKDLDARGGVLEAIRSGYIQQQIAQSAYEYEMAIETRKRVVVGKNKFTSETTTDVPPHQSDPHGEAQQIERLHRLRQTRDGAAVASALNELKSAASTSENLLPILFKAVSVYGTVGEICDVLREVWGEYKPHVHI